MNEQKTTTKVYTYDCSPAFTLSVEFFASGPVSIGLQNVLGMNECVTLTRDEAKWLEKKIAKETVRSTKPGFPIIVELGDWGDRLEVKKSNRENEFTIVGQFQKSISFGEKTAEELYAALHLFFAGSDLT